MKFEVGDELIVTQIHGLDGTFPNQQYVFVKQVLGNGRRAIIKGHGLHGQNELTVGIDTILEGRLMFVGYETSHQDHDHRSKSCDEQEGNTIHINELICRSFEQIQEKTGIRITQTNAHWSVDDTIESLSFTAIDPRAK